MTVTEAHSFYWSHVLYVYDYLSLLQLLEQGLRAHPGSQADRWDRIAELVGTKTKPECVARFKVSSAISLGLKWF